MLVNNATIYSKGDISLQNDGKWEGEAPVKPLATGENRKVEFYLYKDKATNRLPRPLRRQRNGVFGGRAHLKERPYGLR